MGQFEVPLAREIAITSRKSAYMSLALLGSQAPVGAASKQLPFPIDPNHHTKQQGVLDMLAAGVFFFIQMLGLSFVVACGANKLSTFR